MSVAAALPDWGAPLAGAGGPAWLVRNAPAEALALPTRLALVRDDGRPGYAIELFRVASGPDIDVFGVVTLRFVGEYDLSARQAALAGTVAGVRLRPIFAAGGYSRLIASEALALAGLDVPMPLLQAGAGVKATVRLSGDGVHAFQAIVASGIAPVIAQIVAIIPGAAVRAPGAASIDGALLAPQLAHDGPWTRAALVEAIAGQRFGAAIGLPAGGDALAASQAAEALADRLCARDLILARPGEPVADPLWQIAESGLANRRQTIALDDEAIAPRAFQLRSEPLVPADVVERELVGEGSPVALPTGFHTVSIDANLPPEIVGAAQIGCDLRFPAAPPHRPQAITRSIRFGNGQTTAAIAVQLAPSEPPSFEYRTFVIAAIGGGGGKLSGPPLRCDRSHLTIPPDAFAVEFLRAEATPALLRWGRVAVAWSAQLPGGAWQAHADLTADHPAIAAARPRGAVAGAASAALHGAGGASLALSVLDADDVWLDLAMLDAAQPQEARFRCAFAASASSGVTIECAALDAAGQPLAPVTLGFAPPDRDTASFAWLPENPFHSGLVCRWSAQGEWSPPQRGGSTLVFAAADAGAGWPGSRTADPQDSPAAGVAGIELLAAGDASYLYRPRAPSLQLGADGLPAVQLLAAGTVTLLQVTAEWTVSPSDLAELAEQLGQRDGIAPDLRPAPDTPVETALVLRLPQAAEITLASGTAMGAPPQTSLLAASLDDGQAQLVRRALAGERGLLRLRYVVDAADPASREAGFAETTSDAGGGSAVLARAASTGFHRHRLISEADVGQLVAS